MRVRSLLMMGILAAAYAIAGKATGDRGAAIYNGPTTKVSGWIWTDKYTFSPGEAVTLHYTVKTNGDLYPYTLFVYVQNNQTGEKSYFPGLTSQATDATGATAEQGYRAAPLQDVTKGVMIGSGGLFPAWTAASDPGMYTFVVQLRDYTGTRILKTNYMKIGVVTKEGTVSGDITSDMTLTNDTKWTLTGQASVKNGATLTIEPGTFVFGKTGTPASILLITRTGHIMAKGTKSRPIVFTTIQPFGQRSRGDWAGVLLLGQAPINVGANTSGNTNEAGTFYVEGLNTSPDGLYGGTDPNWNCGTMEYVRIEYAGFILSPGNEINSFTFAGCGKGTTIDHDQALFGLDDTFEWFGGTMDAKYLIGGQGRDDYLDFQLGWTGRVQFLIGYQSPDFPGNRGIEGDNSEYDSAAMPYSNPTVYNVTFVGTGQPGFDESDSPGIYLRRGTQGSFNNIVVTNFYSSCMEIFNDADGSTQAQADAGKLTMNGILCSHDNIGGNGGATLAGQITDSYSLAYAMGQKGNGAAKNFMVADPLLTRPFEYADPDFKAMFNSPVYKAGWVQPPDDGFFDQSAQFVGAMGDVDWTEEWTLFWGDEDIQ
jgi:hypothetical protein